MPAVRRVPHTAEELPCRHADCVVLSASSSSRGDPARQERPGLGRRRATPGWPVRYACLSHDAGIGPCGHPNPAARHLQGNGGTTGPVKASGVDTCTVDGSRSPIPATGVSAVVQNLTVTAPTTGPYLTANAGAGAGTRPTTTAASQRAGAPALASCRTGLLWRRDSAPPRLIRASAIG
jgi:hypothetical protein